MMPDSRILGHSSRKASDHVPVDYVVVFATRGNASHWHLRSLKKTHETAGACHPLCGHTVSLTLRLGHQRPERTASIELGWPEGAHLYFRGVLAKRCAYITALRPRCGSALGRIPTAALPT